MGAALAALPAIIGAAPQIVSLIEGLIGLIHHQEVTPKIVSTVATSVIPSPTFPAEPVVVNATTAPKTGPEKKASVMGDFETIALPFVAPLLSALLKRPIDSAVLMPIVSQLIDDIVALNNALGIFNSSK